jgi:hypothetical protein
MLYGELIAVSTEIHTKHIKVNVLNVKPRGTRQKISRFKELRTQSASVNRAILKTS